MNDYVFERKFEVYCGPMKCGKTKFLLARLGTLNYIKGISIINYLITYH